MAKKCQIIPEYMELAKVTVDRLLNDRACDAEDEKHGELMVIDAFENVWTVMSSFWYVFLIFFLKKIYNHLVLWFIVTTDYLDRQYRVFQYAIDRVCIVRILSGKLYIVKFIFKTPN